MTTATTNRLINHLVSVVVIGGSHAGLAVSHKLLRQTTRAKITLINPSDEYYFNIAAPRFLVKHESLPQSKCDKVYKRNVVTHTAKKPQTSI